MVPNVLAADLKPNDLIENETYGVGEWRYLSNADLVNSTITDGGKVYLTTACDVGTSCNSIGQFEYVSTAHNTTVTGSNSQFVVTAKAYDTVVENGAVIIAAKGLFGLTYPDDPNLDVSLYPAQINDTVVNNGGKEYVYAGGTSNNSIINTGGAQYIYSSDASPSTVSSDVGKSFGATLNGGSQYVYAGGESHDTTVNNGSTQWVYSPASSAQLGGGKAYDTTVNSGGSQKIQNDGAIATGNKILGGTQTVSDSGQAIDNTIANNAYQNVLATGVIKDTTVSSSSQTNLYDGAVSKGYLDITDISVVAIQTSKNQNINIENLTIDSTSRGTLANNTDQDAYSVSISNLENNGTMKIANSVDPTKYHVLNVGTLSGNGVYEMQVDIGSQVGDLLKVNQLDANSQNQLIIANNGSTNASSSDTLTVVETTNGGQASQFALKNNVELGGLVYGLRQNGTNWELYSKGQTTSTADAATSFLNVAYLTTYIENQTLLQRLGDLRNSEVAGVKSDGLWIKGFGGKLSSFSGNTMKGFDMAYTGTQLGIDKNIESDHGRFLVGVMAGFTRTNPNYREGNGTGKNYTAGLYATYLNDNGIYIDNVLKYNSMHNQFSVKDTAGSSVKGTGKTQGIMLSTEIGKRFWLGEHTQGFYIEPQAQLSYGYQNGDTVHASNGLKIGLSHYNSTLGRVSGIVGYQTQGENPINVYVKAGVVREMSGGASYRFNHGEKIGHSFRSNWFDNGVGANVTINKQHNIYAEADYSTGNQFDNAMLNLGYRYSF